MATGSTHVPSAFNRSRLSLCDVGAASKKLKIDREKVYVSDENGPDPNPGFFKDLRAFQHDRQVCSLFSSSCTDASSAVAVIYTALKLFTLMLFAILAGFYADFMPLLVGAAMESTADSRMISATSLHRCMIGPCRHCMPRAPVLILRECLKIDLNSTWCDLLLS